MRCVRTYYLPEGRTRCAYWIAGFVAATALAVVPTPLIEPRYFVLPYLILRLELARATVVRPLAVGAVMLELAWHAMLNAGTLYMFVWRPFSWAHEAGVQRFMW